MRKAHQILAGLIALAVVVQVMAIAYALFGLGKWIEDGATVNKAVVEAVQEGDIGFRGAGGFAIHGMAGMMIIPVIALVFLIVSLLANREVPGAAKRGAIIFALIVLQVVLGLAGHSAVLLGPLHALNGLGILAMAGMAARKAGEVAPAPATA